MWIGGSAVALVLLAGLTMLRSPDADPAAAAVKPAGKAWGRSPFEAVIGPAAPPSRSNGATAEILGQASSAFADKGKFAVVERLSRSGRPADAYAAYLLLRECVAARRRERDGGPPASAVCADISPGQLESRGHLLDQAASAGVRGSLWSFLGEGVDGSGVVPDGTAAALKDPATAAFFAKARSFQEAAGRNGDGLAAMATSAYAETEEHDPAKALAYWVAQERIALAAGEAASTAYAGTVARLRVGLSDEQVAAAIEEGSRMAASASDGECAMCAGIVDASVPQKALVDFVRQRLGSADPGANEAGRVTPSTTYTVCKGDNCSAVGYQAAGVWLPLDPAKIDATIGSTPP